MSGDLRLDGYLARTGHDGRIAPDLATLTALQAAHVDAIPFEGLDPLLRRPVKLDLASVQDTPPGSWAAW
ncbi:MAG: arylamine N-acetyltransferase [Proteobacteria bacterium]|nr:arylamine N-acetyltransferase [Pseudomonadota bacterium]